VTDAARDLGALVTGRRQYLTVAILSGMTALAPLSMDMYLPAFPQLAADLGATTAQVQATLAANVAGIVVGQVVLSSLSDAYGRRRIVLTAMAATVVLSVGQALAPSIAVLTVLRFLAGVSAGAGIAIARAIAADITSGQRAARLFSLFIALAMVGPIVAPVLGGAVFALTGTWRSSFVALGAAVAALTVAVALAIPETLPPRARHGGGLRRLVVAGGALALDRRFVGYALVLAFSYSALFAYLAAGPFALQVELGLTPTQYAVTFGINAMGVVGVGLFNARLVRRYAPARLLGIGLGISAVASVGLLVLLRQPVPPVLPVLAALMIVLDSRGLMTPNATFLGVERADLKGTASAILGAATFAGGVVVSPILGALPMPPGQAMGTVILGGTVGAVLAALLTVGRRVDGPGSATTPRTPAGTPGSSSRHG